MKNNYYIELCGCDDTTPFVMELDENEVNLFIITEIIIKLKDDYY